MWTMPRRVASRHPTNPARPAAPILNYCQYLAASRIALSHFCYRSRKTLTPQGPGKLPKLDVAGSTPVARSLDGGFFAALCIAISCPLRGLWLGAGSGAVWFAGETLDRLELVSRCSRAPTEKTPWRGRISEGAHLDAEESDQ